MDTYWRKIKRDYQHQLEEVLDWAANLEYLQAVLQEFDPAATPKEEIMIQCFLEGLRFSIRALLDARGRELDFWEEAVEKFVNVEVKALLQSASSTRKMDQHCPQDNRPVYTTVAKLHASIQNLWDKSSTSSAWYPQNEPPRSSHPHSSWSESDKISEKSFWKEKKKQRHLDHEQTRKDSTPNTGVHTLNVASMAHKDLSYITYFNYNKKSHYMTKYLKAKKDSDAKDWWQSWQPPRWWD